MEVMQKVKENPWKTLFGSSSAIIAIVGALFAIDSRYAHAADVEKDKAQTQRIIQLTTSELRKQMIEDKLFELDVKRAQAPSRRLSPVDEALRERYQRQLNDINLRKEVK